MNFKFVKYEKCKDNDPQKHGITGNHLSNYEHKSIPYYE